MDRKRTSKNHATRLFLMRFNFRKLSLVPFPCLDEVCLQGFSVLVHLKLAHFVVVFFRLASPRPRTLLPSASDQIKSDRGHNEGKLREKGKKECRV